jgi:hypothetical protein
LRISGNQDVKTVKLLRLGVGVVGVLLPITLIFFNWVMGDPVIVPSSMSSSYYTSTRDLFVGSLCALGVFLIGYRHTKVQDLCTWFAGACALAVAFAPTAPKPPQTEPAWINYLHHSAAGALIFIFGLFCWIVFVDYSENNKRRPKMADRFTTWLAGVRRDLRRPSRRSLYLICGFLVFASGILALYTGVWPTSWSTGWPSLYLFEAVAVFAFGTAWIAAGLEDAIAIEKRAAADTEHQLGPEHPDTLTAQAYLAASYWSAGRIDEARTVEGHVADGLAGSQDARRERVRQTNQPIHESSND